MRLRPSSIFAALTLTLLSSFPALSSILPHTSPTPLPLIIWHGLGDNYAAPGLQHTASLASSINPGTYTYIIRLSTNPSADRTSTFLGNLTTQLTQVCHSIATDPILSSAPAINALGFSQGGQFLRAYIERCNTPPVRNLVTFGSQHNGIVEFQACAPTDLLCKGAMRVLKSNTWSPLVQSRLVPAQYYRDPKELESYLKHSNFLADVNNERAVRNETYKRNLAGLRRFVMYMFEEDKVVVPKETSWFAEGGTGTGEVVYLRDRRMYKEDWLGLRELDERGGVEFRVAKGGHMELDDELLEDAFRRYFAPEGKEDDVEELYHQDV